MGENRRRRKPGSRRLSEGRSRAGNNEGYQSRSGGRTGAATARVVHLPRRSRDRHHKPRRASAASNPKVRAVGRRRVQVVAFAVALAGLLMGARAIYLSVVDTENFQALAAEQGDQVSQPTEDRGDIISADGRKLATSLKTRKIVATPYLIHSPEQAADEINDALGSATDLDESEIKDAVTQRNDEGSLIGYSVIADQVNPEVASKIENLGIEGITTLPSAKRVYPEGEIASQLTGHLGDYGEAFGGVEARYADTLKSGKDVNLTIDAAVQQQLEEALASASKEYKAKNALGMVMRVNNGEIVAMADTPGYDNNDFDEASAEEQRNRVITDAYEPGSTFKAITMSAAIQEGVITPHSRFTVPDHIRVADRIINDSLPHKTRVMTPKIILQESSNVGTIKVARKLGDKDIEKYIGRFGFGEPTGVDLWGEASGSVPALKDWSGSSIGNIPVGQGVAVTPLQLAAAYATIANGGVSVTPHVLKGADKDSGSRVISEDTSSIVSGMLRSVVEKGTGIYARIPGYSVAGKTGTSQKVDPKTGTYGDKYTASFVGFAPASDPKYVALIVVDEPQDVIWGETVCAPAFQKVMRFTLGYFNIPPDLESSQKKEKRRRNAHKGDVS